MVGSQFSYWCCNQTFIVAILSFLSCYYYILVYFEAVVAQGHENVTSLTGCGFDPHSRKWNIYINLYFYLFALVSRQRAELSSDAQHATLPNFGEKWGVECLNTRFPLPTLLCEEYIVKLIFFILVYLICKWNIIKIVFILKKTNFNLPIAYYGKYLSVTQFMFILLWDNNDFRTHVTFCFENILESSTLMR